MKLCIKYRLNPTAEQEQTLRDLGFYATKLYNTNNHIRRIAWDENGRIPNWYQ
ncbi:MAG: helix-turn-helix domain-containing protein [Candidatus Altiarchaeales archaeon]|nr:helix-turn-helix domain-containing protein [Candidatus Altiarchaeales archaeon]